MDLSNLAKNWFFLNFLKFFPKNLNLKNIIGREKEGQGDHCTLWNFEITYKFWLLGLTYLSWTLTKILAWKFSLRTFESNASGSLPLFVSFSPFKWQKYTSKREVFFPKIMIKLLPLTEIHTKKNNKKVTILGNKDIPEV